MLENKELNSQTRLKGKRWYIFYTCPKAEKKVQQELIEKQYEVFLPVIRKLRVWKNRQRKYIDVPLFPNYIFVHTYKRELFNIIKLPNIITYIHCAGKPSMISSEDIEGIKKMLSLETQKVSVTNNFNEGEKVRIIEGPLTGYEGVLNYYKGRSRFGIKLKEINQTVLIEINANIIEKIRY